MFTIGLFFSANRTQAAAFETTDHDWQGTSELVALAQSTIGKARVKVVSELDWSKLSGADSLLVLHPETSLDFAQASTFLSIGGRLAVVDDFGAGTRLLDRFHIYRKAAPREPLHTLRDNKDLAVALPVTKDPSARGDGRHPIVAKVDEVVTNHPTALRPEPGVELTPVLEVPAVTGAASLLALVGVIGDAERCGLASAASNGSHSIERCGRLFAMSDPSVFINLMLRYPGNRALAQGLFEYLAEDDTWGERNGSLYILSNDFKQVGSVSGSFGSLAWLNRRADAFSELLSKLRVQGLPNSWAVALAGAIALGLALFTAREAGKAKAASVPRFALPIPFVAQGGPVGRASVLSSGSTHRALAVLELKTALLEALSQRLGLGQSPTSESLLAAIERSRLLSKASSAKLAKMLTEMSKAETAIMRSRRLQIRLADIGRYHREIGALLAEIDRGGRNPS